MIFKQLDIKKISLLDNYIFLLYGENEGLKNEIVKNQFEKNYSDNIYRYEENEVLKNEEQFIISLFSKSFFENKKLKII